MLDRMQEDGNSGGDPCEEVEPDFYKMLSDDFDELEAVQNNRFKYDGMVAFFDVLGYGELTSTACEEVIRNVMDAVKAAHIEAREVVDDIDKKHEGRSFQFGSDYADIRCVNISDSLIFHDAFQHSQPNDESVREHSMSSVADRFYRFIRFCRKVYGVLLERGLPTRGAISVGTYYWDQANMLAGKSVIEAYKTSESLSFSGLVLTENTVNKVRKKTNYLFGPHFPHEIDFLKRGVEVYVKGRGGDELRAMDVVIPDMSFLKSASVDEYVKMQFGAFRKPVSKPRVKALMKNTIDVLNHSCSQVAN